MHAVDTNVLVRILTEDHPEQTAAAQSLFRSGDIWISKTVLLETAWVLTKAYDFTELAVAHAFELLLGTSNTAIEDEPSVAAAITLVRQGLGFADALHLTGIPPNTHFYTFDRPLIRRAKRAGITCISAIE